MLFFEVLGQPQGKARARVTRWGVYTPEKTALYENLIKLSFKQKYSKLEPLTGYLKIEILAVFEPPKSTSKKKREQMIYQEIKPSKKPDIDNICKVFLDALNGIAYKDATQVIELVARKCYGEQASVIVNVEEI